MQYRRTVTTRNPNLLAFLTVGAAGGGSWQHIYARTYTETFGYVGGRFVEIEPRTLTYPAHSNFRAVPPFIPVFGGGVERTVTDRIALRADLSAAIGPYIIPAVRGSVGAVVRFGRGGRSSPRPSQ